MNRLDELGQEYIAYHNSIAECCKRSCGTYSYAKYVDPHEYRQETLYQFNFGGYCIGGCSRWHGVSATSIEELVAKVRNIFELNKRGEATPPSDEEYVGGMIRYSTVTVPNDGNNEST